MSLMHRMTDVIQEKLNTLVDRNENPTEALDLAYQKQVQTLQNVRRSVADVLTSQKRLELQAAQLKQSESKLQQQATQALAAGREDLARPGRYPQQRLRRSDRVAARQQTSRGSRDRATWPGTERAGGSGGPRRARNLW